MYKIKAIGAIIARWPFIGTIIAIMPTEAATHNRKEVTRHYPKASQHTDKYQPITRHRDNDKPKNKENTMKPLAINTLSFALVAAWLAVASTTAADPQPQYGGFSPDADGHQAYLDYIHSLDMVLVKAGDELQQAVEAIPVKADISITPQQEADLRDWLYDFLVAFSASGSDSLAATFYLREGVDDPDEIQQIKERLESGPSAAEIAEIKKLQEQIKAAGLAMSIPIPEPVPDAGDTPLAILKTQHRKNLDAKGCDYFFGNISFFDSAYRVFELQGEYEHYWAYIKTHGLLPMGYMSLSPMGNELEEALQAGEKWVAAQLMFIFEEPEEVADFEKGPMRYPFFVRLVWSPEKAMWRLVEIVMPNNAPVRFSFL